MAFQDFALANGVQIIDNISISPCEAVVQEPMVVAKPKDEVSTRAPLSADTSFGELIS